ncbi:hypothetical protein PTKU15_88940 [Paraburkholderia terrae]|nr:hypothetical protein PTKU15_88940 [Paraburkholderia terrae]
MILRSSLAVLAVGAHAAASAQALPPLPPGGFNALPGRAEQDPGQRLLQEQQDRQRRNEIQQAPAQIAAPEVPALPNLPEGADIDTLPDVEPMFEISHIEFIGDRVLGQKELDRIAFAPGPASRRSRCPGCS